MLAQRTTLIATVGMITVLGAAVWMARPAAKTGQPRIPGSGTSELAAAAESRFDFGTISMAAGPVTHSFTIRNSGSSALRLERIYTSCMCTQASLERNGARVGPFGMPGHGFAPRLAETLAPGEEAVLDVTFDPAAHGPAGIGRIERIVTIEHDRGDALELAIAATVTP